MAKRRNHNGVEANGAPQLSDTQAAYFLSLTVRNTRCFGNESQTIKLSDKEGRPAKWTVLLGENGTGKTTILQVLSGIEPIRVMELPDQQGVSIANWFDGSPPRVLIRKTGKDLVRGGTEFAETDVQLFVGSPFHEANIQSEIIDISFKTNGDKTTWPTTRLRMSRLPLRCYGYGASRRFSLRGLSESEQDDATASLFSDDANLRNAEDWLLTLDYSASKKSDFQERQKQLRDSVTKLLIKIFPDEEIEGFQFIAGEGTHPKPRVEAKTHYGWVSLRQLGHGYRTLVAWVVDLVSRLVENYPDYSNPFEAPAVVLVDEIDLHMHPLWQRKLMDELTTSFPNTQFIVTAHSPLIVQAAAENANIALLRREGDHVVIDNDVGYIRGWSVDQLLTSDLFGLPSSRPPQFDAPIERRKQLLMKSKLTREEKRELAELEKIVFSLPGGETAEQAKTSALILESLELLKKNQPQPQ